MIDVKDMEELALRAAEVQYVGGTPFVQAPEGTKVVDLEHLLRQPTRKRGTVTLTDVDSFIRMVEREKNSSTAIYCNTDAPSFTAVFNDHDVASAGWGDHRAVYKCPLSVEWQTWKCMDGQRMTQEQFAHFIENNLPDIAIPPAADMLEISRTLEAKKKVNFASGIRLANGQNELTYEEDIQGTAAKGKLQVPEEFTIGIPVLEGGIKYAVQARLRYRIGEGKMGMWYELVRPHKIIEDAVREVRSKIEQSTALTIFNGYM